jgi:hypothetical protein
MFKALNYSNMVAAGSDRLILYHLKPAGRLFFTRDGKAKAAIVRDWQKLA